MTERATPKAARRMGISNAYQNVTSPRPEPLTDASETITLFLKAQAALDSVSTMLQQVMGHELAKAWHYQGLPPTPDQDAALLDLREAQNTVRSLSDWMGRQAALLKVRHPHEDDQRVVFSQQRNTHLSQTGASGLARMMRNAIGSHGLCLPAPATNDILKLFR